MSTIKEQIFSANAAICRNIENLSVQRDLLSQNILSQLRNLVEGLIVLFDNRKFDDSFKYDLVKKSCDAIRGMVS